MALIDILRPRRRPRSQARPKTTGEAFWINLIKAFGRALGGPAGRALEQKKRSRRRWFWDK